MFCVYMSPMLLVRIFLYIYLSAKLPFSLRTFKIRNRYLLGSITLFMVITFTSCLQAQGKGLADETLFSSLEKKVIEVQNNPQQAQEIIDLYSLKAKLEKNPEKLYRAYALGTIYAENRKKMAYADSMLQTASRINRPDIMGDALMTNGMLHELTEDYNVALNSYVQAQRHLLVKNNPYLVNVLNLSIARIRNYLGQNKEAKAQLLEAVSFFRENHGIVEDTDYRPYYMHSLIALLDTHSKLGEFSRNEKLVTEGIAFITKEKLPQFRPYFIGSQGIDAYYQKNYPLAISKLEQTLALYTDNWKHLTEKFYLGMSYYHSGNETEALKYLNLLDKEFEKTRKIDPQFRPAFETLYEHHKKTGNVQKQLEYVNKLLQINTLYEKNYKDLFRSLSSHYDNTVLKEEKVYLQEQLKKDRIRLGIITGASLIITVASLLLALRYYRRRNHYKKLYEEFMAVPEEDAVPEIAKVPPLNPVVQQEVTQVPEEEKAAEADEALPDEQFHPPPKETPGPAAVQTPGTELNPLLVDDILAQLDAFENEKAYLKKNLTLNTLAAYCGTNSSYLSKVINQHKGQNFSGYLNTLRLNEAIHLWKTKPKTRKLSIQETAQKLGYRTAQSFSKNFQERYHISPTYFLKRLNEDMPVG